MKLRKTLLALAVSASMPGMLLAAGNTSLTEQTGENNQSAIVQTNQTSADASAIVRQDGKDLDSSITQGSTNYSATVTQYGDRNSSTVTQRTAPPTGLGTVVVDQLGGNDNTVVVDSRGFTGVGPDGNDVTVLQDTNSENNQATVTIAGGANTVNTQQDYVDNTVTIDVVDGSSDVMVDTFQVEGHSNTATVFVSDSSMTTIHSNQAGDEAAARINVVGSVDNMVTTFQSAVGNQLSVDVNGGGLNIVDITQGAIDSSDVEMHVAEVIIAGFTNTATISQVGGSGSMATIDIAGDQNNMTIDQYNCVDCIGRASVQ